MRSDTFALLLLCLRSAVVYFDFVAVLSETRDDFQGSTTWTDLRRGRQGLGPDDETEIWIRVS